MNTLNDRLTIGVCCRCSRILFVGYVVCIELRCPRCGVLNQFISKRFSQETLVSVIKKLSPLESLIQKGIEKDRNYPDFPLPERRKK